MYWGFAIIVAVMIFGFLSKCFVLWLSSKIIRAGGGNWSNCVKLNWVYITTAFVLGIVCFLTTIFGGGGMSSLAFVVLAFFVALWYIIKKTMEILEIGFLMFILLCIVEAIIESAISGGIFYADKFFPFIEQVQTLFESTANKF